MKKTLVALAVLASACATASAQSASDASWSLSGFGTLGAVVTDTDQAQYAIYGQSVGAKKEPNLGPDTKLGVQLGGKLNSMFSGTVQVMSKRNGHGNWKPEVEWAFVKAQATPGIALRAGRMGTPLFMVSDFRDVNYANTWLRPPQDVYGQVPFRHFDGADITGQTQWGPATITGQVYGGKIDANTAGVAVHASNLVGMTALAEFDNGLSLRVGTVDTKLTAKNSTVAGFVAILRQTPFAAVGDQLDATNKDARFSGVGIGYDHDNWIANAEYTQRKNKSFVSSTTGWAVTGGYRVGKFTPYAVVSELHRDSTNVTNNIPTATVQLATLHATVDAILQTQNFSQKTLSLGSRWDFASSMAGKIQYDQIKQGEGARGLFYAPAPTFVGKTVNVLSVSVDFVF